MADNKRAPGSEVYVKTICKMNNVVAYVPMACPRRRVYGYDSSGEFWIASETMKKYSVDEFGQPAPSHYRYPVTFKSNGELYFLMRYFFNLNEGDFGCKQVFTVTVKKRSDQGVERIWLELNKTGHPDRIRPGFLLKTLLNCKQGIEIPQFPGNNARIVFVPCSKKCRESSFWF